MSLYQHYGEQDAAVAQTAAGATVVVSGVPDKKIRVLGYAFTLSAAGTLKFRSGAGTDKTGAMTVATNGGMSSSGVPFMCGTGEDLYVVSTVGAANGHVNYQLIPA